MRAARKKLIDNDEFFKLDSRDSPKKKTTTRKKLFQLLISHDKTDDGLMSKNVKFIAARPSTAVNAAVSVMKDGIIVRN